MVCEQMKSVVSGAHCWAEISVSICYNLVRVNLKLESVTCNILLPHRVGTKRYMSPEVLDGSIREKTTFEAFRHSDVYSFALVMWEVLHRTDLG